jgi:hypothetical protein
MAAREAAARANVSVSKWFAQFAQAEKAKRDQDWTAYWKKIDQHQSEWQKFPLTEALNTDIVANVDREAI